MRGIVDSDTLFKTIFCAITVRHLMRIQLICGTHVNVKSCRPLAPRNIACGLTCSFLLCILRFDRQSTNDPFIQTMGRRNYPANQMSHLSHKTRPTRDRPIGYEKEPAMTTLHRPMSVRETISSHCNWSLSFHFHPCVAKRRSTVLSFIAATFFVVLLLVFLWC